MEDVFISHRSIDDERIKPFLSFLEENAIEYCFIENGKNEKSEFIKLINEKIDAIPIFALFLSYHVLETPNWIVKEVKRRKKKYQLENFIPIILDGSIDDYNKLPFDIKINDIDCIFKEDIDVMKNKLVAKIKKYLPDREKIERNSAEFYEKAKNYGKHEQKRLSIQRSFLMALTEKHFYKVLDNTVDASILDVGCGPNNNFTSFIDGGRIKHLLGLDYQTIAVNSFNETQSETVEAKLCDITKPELDDVITAYLNKHHLDGFDVINISMVLLFLKEVNDSITLLTRLHKYLKPSGTIFITSIDDELIVCYPDPNNLYKQVKKYSIEDTKSGGYRFTGRQVPYFLTQAGYSNIDLLENGVNTLNKDKETLESLFTMCIMNFRKDYTILSKEGVNKEEKEKGKTAVNFFDINEKKLHDLFMSPGFFCNIGFLFFKAKY